MDNNFAVQLNLYRSLIENELYDILNHEKYQNNRVCDAMKYSLLNSRSSDGKTTSNNGGKRIRGILALAFCDAVLSLDNNQNKNAQRLPTGPCYSCSRFVQTQCMGINTYKSSLSFACALEMIHAYSLIHDDLPCMDNDDYRRGKPSCHIQYDTATALLAGDGLLTLSFETITSCDKINDTQKINGIKILSENSGISGMILGQMLDLQSENKTLNYNELVNMHNKKTGALIKASCQLGIIAGNGDPSQMKLAAEYGEAIGLAFQIKDDILDITSDAKTLGKPINSDAEKGKSGFIQNIGLKKSKIIAGELTDKALNILNKLNKNDFLKSFTHMLLNRKR